MASFQPWADRPFNLIETPSQTRSIDSHSAVYCASEMSHVHNAIIRGLNSIYQQAPNVSKSQDIEDFLFFCHAWIEMVEHHHHAEEATMFPKIATFTKNASIMAGNLEQHEAFQEGLHKLHDYALNTKASTYNAAAVTKIIDSFAPALIKHLREEIDTFLALDKYDSQGLLKVWQESENAAKSTKNPHVFDLIFPCVLGCVDKTYEGGIHSFPPLPFFIPYLVQYWFAAKHRGAWRFCPSNMWGQPRPLAFSGKA
ncbi:hypothetical protein MMC10_008582 [Thelotrema lepadinum]|nr:hypothetical protein [Thelotrema lepadinum]